jgi:hypothetical protein
VFPEQTLLPATPNSNSPLSTSASPSASSRYQSRACDTYPIRYEANVTSDTNLFTLSDMALLHHWTMVTSPNIVQSPSVNYIWQSGFPQFAFENSALMHRILSIAALHRAYLNPAIHKSAMFVAEQHHGTALQGFMRGLKDEPNPGISNAIFGNAVLTFFYAFISFGPLFNTGETTMNPVEHTSRILGASWIPLARGLGPVINRHRDYVTAGPLSSLLDVSKWSEPSLEMDYGIDDRNLRRIEGIWRENQSASEHVQTYDQTLSALRGCHMWLTQSSAWQEEDTTGRANYGPWSGPFIWIFVTPEEYFTLLKQRQPPAMIIFACFGALIHKLDHYWWMEGCGKSIVGVVENCLGPYWDEWMAWPKQVVQL